jgi:archaellum biogenesis ATPase FlaH
MTSAFKPLSIQELLTLDIPEPTWLVEGLMPQGSLILLAAREKSGKGLLTIDLVASIAEGTEFLGRPCSQGKAIYCATEETLSEVKARVLTRTGETEDRPPVMILSLDGSLGDTLDITNPDSVARLRAMIEEHAPMLVVIDVLREIHDRKEDSSDDMAPIMTVLRDLAHRTGATIVLNHHMSKGGQSRGSTAIGGGADVTMELHSDDLDGDTSLGGILNVKGRSVPRQRLRIRYGGDGRWTASGEAPPTPHAANARTRIHAELCASPEFLSVKQIADQLDMKESTVNNELRAMRFKSHL